MAALTEYATAKGQGDLSQEELQHLEEIAKQARRDLAHTKPGNLKDSEEQDFTKSDFEQALRKTSRKVKK